MILYASTKINISHYTLMVALSHYRCSISHIYIYDTSHLIISIPMANILNCGIVSSNYSIYMISIYVYIYTYLVGGLEHEFYFFPYTVLGSS